ncbi:MAG: ABC transporter substrate-binding protein [Microbacteriaceae bacterium]
MKHSRLTVLAAATTVAALSLSACSAGSTEPTATDSTELTEVSVITSNPFSVIQYYGLYLLGVDQGFFADEGIDPVFQEGNGSTTSAQVIAAGNADFGINIGVVAVINNDDQGAGLKLVARDAPIASYAVVSLDAQITDPDDLVGKTIGLPQGTTQALLWDSFLAAADVDPSAVATVNLSPANATQALAQGQVDGIVTYSSAAVPALASLGEDDPSVLSFSDYGITIEPDSGVVTTDALIESDPDLVTHFVAAVEKSIAYAVEHPDEIYAAGAARYDSSFDEDVIAAQADIADQTFLDYTADGSSYTALDLDALDNTLEILRAGGVITSTSDASAYATDEFVP